MSRRWLWMVPKKFRPISIAIIFTKRCHIVIVAMTIHPLQVKFSCDILKHFQISTGKSLSEALIFASINPQYDDKLFIELRVQCMKIPSSEHGENMLCTEIVFYIQNSLCAQHVLPMFCKNKSLTYKSHSVTKMEIILLQEKTSLFWTKTHFVTVKTKYIELKYLPKKLSPRKYEIP